MHTWSTRHILTAADLPAAYTAEVQGLGGVRVDDTLQDELGVTVTHWIPAHMLAAFDADYARAQGDPDAS